MAKKIFKYEIPMSCQVVMPSGAFILHIDGVGNKLFVWAKVDTDAPLETKEFVVLNTGDEVPNGFKHLKTVLFHGGSTVRHVFLPVLSK